ncbi:MAG TPA: nitrilase-related carbon-nitrogen hydrolase [Gammaproteobacteria bacterium]
MASVLDVKRFGRGLLAALATALLLFFGTGLHPLWPLTWFAPLPVLLFALDATGWGAALAAFCGMVLGLLNLWGIFHVLGAPPAILARIYLIEGLVLALAVLLFRALQRRGAHWSALLAFPAFLTSFEWLLNLTSPHGTGGSLAYSQLGFLPFLQLASLTGPWGMTFLLLLFPAALALAWDLRRRAPARMRSLLGVTGALLVAVLVFGAVRLGLPAPQERVKVGLIGSDGPNEDVADEGEATRKLFQAYADEAGKLASDGAQVIVIPEKLGVVVDADADTADPVFQSLADQTGAVIVAGMISVAPPLKYNEARVYRRGQPVLRYDKQHMLPPFESKLTPGTGLVTLQQPSSPWGVEICKDMDFTPLARRYGAEGVGLMLVPGWDFFLDDVAHGHMAIMRGVESGFAVVRAAKGGSLYVSDDRGRVLAEVKSDAAPFSTLLAEVPVEHHRTLFLLWGDWFAWVAVALLGACLARLAWRWKAAPG